MLRLSRVVSRYLTAGGIDVQEDVRAMIPALAADVKSLKDRDLATATYLFEYLAGAPGGEPKVKPLFEALAEEYARRFAGWLGHVFMGRANMTRTSQAMADLRSGLAQWALGVPDKILTKQSNNPEQYLSGDSKKFLDPSVLEKLGTSVAKKVIAEWRASVRTAKDSLGLVLKHNQRADRYEIPKNQDTYRNRDRLKQLGFRFDQVWWIKNPSPAVMAEFKVSSAQKADQDPDESLREWYTAWLPGNVHRFGILLNKHGKSSGTPYEFEFGMKGQSVDVQFKRNLQTVAEAVAELRARYGKAQDRDGWMTAIRAYDTLLASKGKSAMAAIDMANDLEHSHGAMMEHFPATVRSWYPAFLDFKYSAKPWQLVQGLRDEDFRVVADELLPHYLRQDRMDKNLGDIKDQATPRGLALSVSSQPGKPAKQKHLEFVRTQFPKLYHDVVAELKARGLKLNY